jgi:exo-beta-1,3-glucanase (GH17 family)
VPVDTKGDSGSLGLGVTYDAFTGEGQNTQCKDPDRMTKEFDQMKDFKAIRIYAGDCSVIPIAVQSVLKNKQKLMAGAYLPQGDLSETIKAYKAAIDTYAKGDWSVIALFSVENEQVNGGYMTASDVVDAINRARTQLRSLGYNGPVGAVETVKAMVENPAICRAADVAMVNSHAFFDGNVLPEDSGTFVKSQVSMVKQACDNKRVVVTESGWPHEGDRHEKAVPSPQNQKAAIASIRENFDHDMFLFNAFDSPWKSNTAATFNAERFWGIM